MYLPFAETHTLTHQLKTESIYLQCRDPKDQKFLDLALSSKVDFLVTGDDDLLVLGEACQQYATFSIVRPKDFISFLEANT